MKRLIWALGIVAVLVLSFLLFPGLFLLSHEELHSDQDGSTHERWACPMLCVVLENPGLCPVCGMELEEISASTGDVTLSLAERELTGLSFVQVDSKRLQTRITVPGRVTGAETSRAVVTAWTSGRIDRFPAPATGENISSGATVAWIYSPELIEAQHDLLYAQRTGEPEGSIITGARQRMRQLGASNWIIDHVEETGEIMESLPVVSRYSGTVTDRRVESGDWVQTGQVLLEVANLSDVWIESELLEGQAEFLVTGDSVTVIPYSGTGYIRGEVTHMDPYYDPMSRSVTARIQAFSPEAGLLPGELVRVVLSAEVGGTREADIAIPASSVLSLGERHLVYALAEDSTHTPVTSGLPSPATGVSLVPVQVSLGPLSYDAEGIRNYPVISGLSGGEIIADNGAFLIDSQAELTGLPSLMNHQEPQ